MQRTDSVPILCINVYVPIGTMGIKFPFDANVDANVDFVTKCERTFRLILNVFFSLRCRWSGIYHVALLRRQSGSVERSCGSLAFQQHAHIWNYGNHGGKYMFHEFITVHKRSCGRVMFLHLSVILFTGARCIPPLGRHPPGRHPLPP